MGRWGARWVRGIGVRGLDALVAGAPHGSTTWKGRVRRVVGSFCGVAKVQVVEPYRGTYLWTSPNGIRVIRDHHGTTITGEP